MPKAAASSSSARASTSWARARRSRSTSGPPRPRTAAVPSTSPIVPRCSRWSMQAASSTWAACQLPAGQPPQDRAVHQQSLDTRRGPFDSNLPAASCFPINPDDTRADRLRRRVAVDGSPMVYYEDLIVNFGRGSRRQDPNDLRLRDYLVNLIWAHQKLDFKDGASSRALPGLARSSGAGARRQGADRAERQRHRCQSATVPTSFRAERAPARLQRPNPMTSPPTGRAASRSRCRR